MNGILCICDTLSVKHDDYSVFDPEETEVCFEELGCFNKSTPFNGLPLPWSPEKLDVQFVLYTPEREANYEVISKGDIPYVTSYSIFCYHGQLQGLFLFLV